jgi:hypothetical protein
MIVGAETAAKTLVFTKQRRLVLFDLVMDKSGSCAGLPLASKAGDETTRVIMQVIKQ